MRVLIRTSKWAIWARRLGSFALPMLVIPVFLHRARLLDSDTFVTILLVALLIATLGLVAGLVAYVRLWRSGDQGWSKATIGVVFGLICLSPVIYGTIQFVRYPVVNDVSTDIAVPLPLVLKTAAHVPDAALQKQILAAFPNLVTRTYQLDAEMVFSLVEQLIAERGWGIRVRRMPGADNNPGRINAVAMTLFGWRDEIAVRVSPGVDGTRVDMRSASSFGLSDLGVNAKRIGSFLSELDRSLAQNAADNQVQAKTH